MNYTNRRNNTNNKVLKTFKDYLIPIIVVLIVFLLILNNLFSSSENKGLKTVNQSLDVSLSDPSTEAYVILSGWNKTKIENKIAIYQSEKLQVINGWLNLVWSWVTFVLNKLWELRYNEGGNYTLFSSDLWVNATSSTNIEMRYAKVFSKWWSVFSLSQNEVASTIYVLAWVVDVQNLVWKSTTLQKWEKIVIMRNNSNDETIDLSLSKEMIDDYIKSDDWFIKNNWASLLSIVNIDNNKSISSSWTLQTSSWELLSWSTLDTNNNQQQNSNSSYISFNNLYDEMEVDTSNIDISWNIISDLVSRIEIDWKDVKIDNQTRTFNVKWIKLDSRSNDLIYRVYNDSNKILFKSVITVYTTDLNSVNNLPNNTEKKSTLAQVENYPISSSPYYKILTPKQNPYTTSENVVKIEGTVPTRTVEKIIVNDFELKKFPKYWSYWSYFANNDFWNLKPWVNIYKIQYFWAEGKLLHENNFTIIKEDNQLDNTITWWSVDTWTWTIQ